MKPTKIQETKIIGPNLNAKTLPAKCKGPPWASKKPGVPAQSPQKPFLGDFLHFSTPSNKSQICILLGNEEG